MLNLSHKCLTDAAKHMRSILSQHWFLFFIIIVAALLLLLNLGNIYLWQDESETALIAKNILAKGYPNAWDGINLITQNAGLDSNDNYVWTWSPWLQFYTVAASFKLFGFDAFAARLPFALVGLASVVLFYFFTLKLASNEVIARFSTIIFVTSLPFLLHARQARWYALAIIAVIWMLYAYLKLRKGERWGMLHLSLSSIMLFHSNFIVLLGVGSGIAVHYLGGLFFHCKRPLYVEAWNKSNVFEEYSLLFTDRFKLFFVQYGTYINSYFFPIIFFPLFFLRTKKSIWNGAGIGRDDFFLLLLVVCATVLTLSILPWIYFRYLIGLVPVFALLLGLCVWQVWRLNKAVAWVMLVLLMFSNLFSLPLPPHQFKYNLSDFLYEITHNYDGPNEGIVRYLQEHGTPDQFVITNYGQLPIMFYTGMRTIGFSQDLRVPEKADWIIIRNGRQNGGFLRYLSREYQPIVIDYPDLLWGNRPDPFFHHYSTAHNAPRVTLYKRH